MNDDRLPIAPALPNPAQSQPRLIVIACIGIGQTSHGVRRTIFWPYSRAQ
jgi:hypothetical protein